MIAALVKNKRFQDALARETNFRSIRDCLSVDGRKGIAIDPKNQKVCFFTSRSPNRVVKFSDIKESEIVEDLGPETWPPSKGRLLTGHAIGTLLAGALGGMIGGFMAQEPKPQKVNRVSLKVICKEDKQTDHEITFLCEKTVRGGLPHSRAMKAAKGWHEIVSKIIKRGSGIQEQVDADQSVSARIRDEREIGGQTKIRFICKHCGKVLKVDIKYVGRKGKCPKCGKLNVITKEEKTELSFEQHGRNSYKQLTACSICQYPIPKGEAEYTLDHKMVCSLCKSLCSEDNGRKYQASLKGKRRVLQLLDKTLILSFIMCYVGFCLYMFVFRDTWEADNFQRISQMISQAESLAQSERFGKSLDGYNAVFKLVEYRKIKGEDFKKVLEKAKNDCRQVKTKYENEVLPTLQKLDEEASGFLNYHQYSEAIRIYNKILENDPRDSGKIRSFLDNISDKKYQAENAARTGRALTTK